MMGDLGSGMLRGWLLLGASELAGLMVAVFVLAALGMAVDHMRLPETRARWSSVRLSMARISVRPWDRFTRVT